MPTTESILDDIGSPAESTNGSDIIDIQSPGKPRVLFSERLQLRNLNDESDEDFKDRLTEWFEQMMFVSGETAEPSPETTSMIEELVKQQVIEMVS